MRAAAPGLLVDIPAFGFGGRVIFAGLRQRFEGGRWSCILGPSGCGKSSLLRLVAGLVPGAITGASDGGPVAGRLAFMAQSDLLLPWLGVLDNAVLGWRLRGAAGQELVRHRDRAATLLAEFGLGDRLGALPQTLSGGMRQRVALARTLLEDRPIVLMDEPFSALDAITRHRLQELAAAHLRGRTVLLVTHDPREALRLGHEIFVLAGRPAVLEGPLRPGSVPPRQPGEAGLPALEADLLARLTAADERAARPSARELVA